MMKRKKNGRKAHEDCGVLPLLAVKEGVEIHRIRWSASSVKVICCVQSAGRIASSHITGIPPVKCFASEGSGLQR